MKKKDSKWVDFIEYSNPEYSEYSAVAVDGERQVICWIISEYSQIGEKMKYIAVNNQGKAIFPPDENLDKLKKQIKGFSIEQKRLNELKQIRDEKGLENSNELER